MNAIRPAFCVIALVIMAHRADAQDVFYYTSSPSSWVGQGNTRTMTPAGGATFSGFRYFTQGAYTNAVSISVSDAADNWTMEFVGPNLTLPTAGDYPNATRWPFQAAGQPGLDWSGDGRGDNTLTGNFQVLAATFDSAGNLSSFAANFTQYDEGNPAAWNMGAIRYNSDIPVPEPASILLLACAACVCGRGRSRI